MFDSTLSISLTCNCWLSHLECLRYCDTWESQLCSLVTNNYRHWVAGRDDCTSGRWEDIVDQWNIDMVILSSRDMPTSSLAFPCCVLCAEIIVLNIMFSIWVSVWIRFLVVNTLGNKQRYQLLITDTAWMPRFPIHSFPWILRNIRCNPNLFSSPG